MFQGGFRATTWESVQLVIIVGGIATIISLFLAPKINIVNLGEDVCIGLGQNPVRIRMQTLLLIIPMCAVCVAVAGNIAFVGLIVPHIVRKIFRARLSCDYAGVFFMWGYACYLGRCARTISESTV